MNVSLLFEHYQLGEITLANRIVMAPMTRCRSTNNTPNALMAEYYAQRASVGLIITEGVATDAHGLGYSRMPGIFTTEQLEGWKQVSQAIHQQGGKVFMQLMHTGRISHPFNLPENTVVLAPSAIAAAGEMYTDAGGVQPLPVPQEMSKENIQQVKSSYAQAARNAIAAGCDGIELHSANGYLLEQFLRPNSNQRSDEYGGGIEQRAKFVLEVLAECCQAIGSQRVGIRLSPFGVFNDMPDYPEQMQDYCWLAEQLNQFNLAYVHLVDHSAMGAPSVPDLIKQRYREILNCPLILVGDYQPEQAEQDLKNQKCELIAVGRALIANPDIVKRWQTQADLNSPDANTFYTPGPKGYTDYPFLSE